MNRTLEFFRAESRISETVGAEKVRQKREARVAVRMVLFNPACHLLLEYVTDIARKRQQKRRHGS